ncbi:MAG: adenylate/guanylate cyclase domain-containing protein [Lachnospiraceae bacterium]|nr:adenylate/guanylate cyclase domain-containing protein [Lachnospiraceae bacterium]
MNTRGLGKASFWKKLIVSLLVAAIFTGIAGSGILYYVDMALSDSMYCTERAHDGIIRVVGIDQESLDAIGPWPWSREVIATVIRNLNKNPDSRPAVIGIDVIFSGESDPEADDALVQAAKEFGNVVTAEAADFTDQMVVDGDNFYVEKYGITGFDKVFKAYRDVTYQGHVNAMLDKDGILRQGKLWIEPNKDERVELFGWVIYKRYCEALGITPGKQPPAGKLNGFFRIPYSVKHEHFDHSYNVAKVYYDDEGEVGSAFEDKIVLIGPFAAGLADNYITSIDHASTMYGIEVQGNVIQSLLDGRYQKASPDGWQLVLVFILSGASVWFLWKRKVRWTLVWWIGITGGWLLLCKILGENGILLHPLWIPFSITALFISFVAINYIQAALAKHKVTSTFKRYVDPSVINELFREGTDSLGLGGKLTDIAALFVDIRGFTTMSEALPATEVVEILNQYLSLTTKCVMDNHGTLDKFVGDCTMAIWNAPLKQDDYVMNACKAALDMVKGSEELAKQLQEKYGRTVAFGVGVHCGKAVVGNIGAQMRMDYTAIGDTVNTAARLEANAPGGCVYISRAVVDALGDRILATSLGTSIKLKGKADGFEIFTLDGIKEGN